MRIGIDVDDTICNTTENIIKYQNKYLSEKNITEKQLWNTLSYQEEFFIKYLKIIFETSSIKDNAIEYINKLKEQNHQIYIITARANTYIDNVTKITKDYLDKHSIFVNKILINSNDKVDMCLKYHIDYMIDDNYYNITKLKEHNIKTILFDDQNEYLFENVRISNWNQILDIINPKQTI